jgi:hypothetical protein
LKFFIVLLVISFFLLLLYWRMRPYLHAVQKALRVVRQMQEGTGGGLGGLHHRENRSARQTAQPDNRQLIKCAGCGTWVLEARAVTPAGQRAAYCSHSCYEEKKLTAQTAQKH